MLKDNLKTDSDMPKRGAQDIRDGQRGLKKISKVKKESNKPDSPHKDELDTAPKRAKRPGRKGPRDNGIRDDDIETKSRGFSYEVDNTIVYVFTSLEGGL